MTIIERPLTRRTKTCGFDAAAVDAAARQHALAVPGSGAEPLGIPLRFKILCEIGNGGMGIVYKVHDLETGEILALKLLKQPQIASDPQMREEFRMEVCLARKVTHNNVCRIHEFYRSDAASCISMEFVDGETLLSKMRRVGALPVRDAIEITRQICAGLREAHARGIVHRDLKPANIMIDQSGVVKIMDFGIAHLSQENGQVTRTIVGTPEYMAPEQIELKAMGPRTDIYSVGLLLYEMVTGTQAFAGDSLIAVALKQIRESPKRPSEIVSTLPPGLEAVILKCLRKNCDSRFQSIDQLNSALCKLAANGAPNRTVAPFLDFAAEYASAKWRVVLPRLTHLGLKLHRATHHLSQIVRNESKRLALLAVAGDAPDRRKNSRVQVAKVITVATLGILLFWLLGNYEPTTPEGIDSTSLQDLEAAVSAQTHSVSPTALVIDRTSDDSSADVSSTAETSPDSIPPSDTPIVDSVKRRTKLRPISTSLPLKTKRDATNITPAIAEGSSHPSPADQTAGVANPPTVAASVPVPQPAALATASTDQTKPSADNPASVAETYLEVGSFKDTEWADDAVERLSQLGFHAICVHKSILWRQSYHVQVGPYVTNQIDDARKRLSEQGIKSHIVKYF
jgi:serine/threonine protein kinase